MKDSDAQLRAVLFKQQQRYLDIKPADGLEVICRGRITLYEPRGEYQLLVDSIESLGAGQLQIEFDKYKKDVGKKIEEASAPGSDFDSDEVKRRLSKFVGKLAAFEDSWI